MRIVLDMDQIIADWVQRILEWYNQDKGTSLTKENIVNWNMTMNLGPNSEDFLRSCMRYPELYRDLEPIEGAIHGVQKLVSDGHDVLIASAVPKCAGIAYHGKLEWIRRNMPFFSLNNFIAIQRKDLIDGDILFDDGLHNIMPWVKRGRWGVVMDCPWNRTVGGGKPLEENRLIVRVKHWNEFLQFIDRIKNQNAADDHWHPDGV